MVDLEEDPNKPFSIARVAVWALGAISFISVIGLVFIVRDAEAIKSVVDTSVGALATAMGVRLTAKAMKG